MERKNKHIQSLIQQASFENIHKNILTIYNSIDDTEKSELIDNLISLFSDNKWLNRKKASFALSGLGDIVIDRLEPLVFNSSSKDVIYWALNTISSIESDKVIKFYKKAFSHSNPVVREYALMNIKRVNHPEILDMLINAFNDPVWGNRKLASDHIIEMGMGCVKRLNSVYKTSSIDQKFWIIKTLGAILKEKGIEPLAKFIDRSDSESRYLAMVALASTQEEKAIPYLIKSLRDNEWFLRFQAASYLESFGEKITPYLEKLVRQDIHGDLAYWTYKLLARQMGVRALNILSEKAKNLSGEKGKELKIIILSAASEIMFPETITFLIGFIDDNEWIIRKHATEILSRFCRFMPEKVLPIFEYQFSRENEHVCFWLLKAASKTKSIFDKLITHFNTLQNKNIRLNIIQAISGVSNSKDYIDILINGLMDDYWPIRKKSSEILKTFGSIIVPVLMKGLEKYKNKDYYFWTQKILQDIVPEGVKALTNFLRNNNIHDLNEYSLEKKKERVSYKNEKEDSKIFDQELEIVNDIESPTDKKVKKYLIDLIENEFEEIKLLSLNSLMQLKLHKNHIKMIKDAFAKLRKISSPDFIKELDKAEESFGKF